MLIVLAYIVLGYFAFLIVGGLLCALLDALPSLPRWKPQHKHIDEYGWAATPYVDNSADPYRRGTFVRGYTCTRCGSSTHTATFHQIR